MKTNYANCLVGLVLAAAVAGVHASDPGDSMAYGFRKPSGREYQTRVVYVYKIDGSDPLIQETVFGDWVDMDETVIPNTGESDYTSSNTVPDHPGWYDPSISTHKRIAGGDHGIEVRYKPVPPPML